MILLPKSLETQLKRLDYRKRNLPTDITTHELDSRYGYDFIRHTPDFNGTNCVSRTSHHIKFIEDVQFNYYIKLSSNDLLEKFLDQKEQLKELEELREFKRKITAAKEVIKNLGE